MAFLQPSPVLPLSAQQQLAVAPRRRAFLVVATVKTKRRARRASTTHLPRAVPWIAPRQIPEQPTTRPSEGNLSQLPGDLLSHSLLSLADERKLVDQIQFLRDVERVRDDLTADGGQASDDSLALRLSLTPDQFTQRRRDAIRARNRLVTANIRLVSTIANEVHKMDVMRGKRRPFSEKTITGKQGKTEITENTGISNSDLIQEGCIALTRAAERYDGRADVRFSTYASRAIWSACRRAAVPASCIVTLPERLRRAVRRKRIATSANTTDHTNFVNEEENDTCSENTEAAMASQTAEHTPVHLVRLAERHLTSGVSLDETLPARTTAISERSRQVSRGEMLSCTRPSPEAFVSRELLRNEVRTACYENLPQRQAEFLVLRFGLNDQPPMPVKDIAERHGLSTVRVSQVISEARRALKQRAPQLQHLLPEL